MASKFDLTPEEEKEAAILKAEWDACTQRYQKAEAELKAHDEWWRNSEERKQHEAEKIAIRERQRPIQEALSSREQYLRGLILQKGASSPSWYRGNHNVKPAAWDFLKRHFKVSYLNQWEKEQLVDKLIEQILSRDEKHQELLKQAAPFNREWADHRNKEKELYHNKREILAHKAGWQGRHEKRKAREKYEDYIDKKARHQKEQRRIQNKKQNKKRQEADWNELAKEFDELLPLLEL